MFSHPRLEAARQFPKLPLEQPEWHTLLATLNVTLDQSPGSDDTLTQLTRYAVGWVERREDYVEAWHSGLAHTTYAGQLLKQAGFVDRIDPEEAVHDYALVDGGNMKRYEIRLNYAEQLKRQGLLKTPNMIVFGGQSRRSPNTDRFENLAPIAKSLIDNVEPWASNWLAHELSKSDHNPDPWQRPFATERELGLLCLLRMHQGSLKHERTYERPDATSIDPTIPVATTAADSFTLGGQKITLLNAPAKIREHAGEKLDISHARPTGRSCFYEWLTLDNPPENSSVLLLTHAPNIYRSWLDMLLRAAEAERQDLRITAAGAALEPGSTIGDVLEGLGNLIINHYNREKEGGIDSPAWTPFKMLPRP